MPLTVLYKKPYSFLDSAIMSNRTLATMFPNLLLFIAEINVEIGAKSHKITFLFVSLAATPVIPEPEKTSKTKSFSLV